MQSYSSTNPNALTPVVKNLLIINGLLFLAKFILAKRGVDLDTLFGLFHPYSSDFRPWQLLTHMFMHADIRHIFGNMLGLFFFGRMLEARWGGQRFLFFYLISGFSAVLLHYGIIHYQMIQLMANMSPEFIALAKERGVDLYNSGNFFNRPDLVQLGIYIGVPTIGASGAVFGILGGCLILFPNTQLYLLFPPIPIKLKYAITFYGLYELFSGIANIPGDNIAHFAHLGGLAAGIILVKYWNKTRRDSFF
ncbi:MAG: membrane associated rhomboid family serine protease [Bacteroidia bacterium]|jgi:membrane associated rhomboid family serine protease